MSRRSPQPASANRPATANGKPADAAPTVRPPANNVLQSFLNEWGIVLVQGLAVERTEGGKMIVGPTVQAAYRDQLRQQGQQPPAPAPEIPAE